MHALIVEDSPVFVKIIERTLQTSGFSTTTVGTAGEAMAALERQIFEILILDLNLPDQNGLDFCRRLRGHSRCRLMPVLMLTSDESEELLQQALEAGVTELFHKTRLAEIEVTLREYIERTQRQYRGKVLLVEDSPTTATLLKYMLTRMSLTVDQLDTAEAALETIPQGNYDLIVSDIVLAGKITGLGLVRAVRAMEGEVARTPILGLSASEDVARRIEMLRMGANDYVPKPVIEEEFVARVGNLVSAKQLLDEVLAQRRELRERSIRDPLTGLYNRRFLGEAAERICAQSEREQQPVSFWIADLDHFKSVNDTYGHDRGDEVLAGFARLFAECAQPEDVPARFGGEEFVMLLPNCERAVALERAERMLEALRALRPGNLPVTASIGVSTVVPPHPCHFDQLFKAADEAVYQAKETGRNRVVPGAPIA